MDIVVLDSKSDGLAYECTKSDTAMVSEYKGPKELKTIERTENDF